MEKVVGLVNRLQQICTSLGDNALNSQSILWNKLPTIVVVGGQVRRASSCACAQLPPRSYLPCVTGHLPRGLEAPLGSWALPLCIFHH